MTAIRQVLGGLLALFLVGGTVAASMLLAFRGPGAQPSAAVPTVTATFTQPPAAASPTAAPPTATAARPSPSATASAVPSSTASPAPSPTPTSAPPTATATPVPSATAPPPPTAAPPTAVLPTVCVPAPLAGWALYVIQSGDTLFSLALKFGVSQAALQSANCIGNPSDIQAGVRIYAPMVSTQPPPATAPPAVTPTVPSDIPTITSMPVPTATPNCVPPEFFDPLLNRCRLPDS